MSFIVVVRGDVVFSLRGFWKKLRELETSADVKDRRQAQDVRGALEELYTWSATEGLRSWVTNPLLWHSPSQAERP